MAEKVQVCDWCGASWQLRWKCQIICPNCGAKQDCSDLFVDYDEIQRQREARQQNSQSILSTDLTKLHDDQN